MPYTNNEFIQLLCGYNLHPYVMHPWSSFNTTSLPLPASLSLCPCTCSWAYFHSCTCFCSKACIFILQPLALTCEACGTQRKKSDGNLKGWSCKFCTLDNSSLSERCLACGEWRYSNGPPISTPGPYPGT